MAESNNHQDDGINKIEKRLFSSRPLREPVRSELSQIGYDVKSGWVGDDRDIKTMKKEKDIQTPILRTLLIFSAIFFLSALGISAYFIWGGSNLVSSDNIDISLTGPVSVKGGEDFDLQVIIGNRNKIILNAAKLIVEYPEGGHPSGGTISRYTKDIGQIGESSVINEVVKSVLFGEENSEQDLNVTLEYRTEGSNATFVKTKTFKTFISSSPISLSMDLPEDTNSGKSMDLNVTLNSNSSDILKDVVLEMAYPSGFVFSSAVPPPSYGNNIWSLGDLLAQGKRSIHITGVLEGQDSEVKTFRVNAGTRNNIDENKISVLYGSSLKSLVVQKPYIGLGLAINGDRQTTDYIADSSQNITGDIEWVNNLPVKILDGQLSVKINGEVLDKNSISAGSGIYKSADGKIVWDKLNGNFPQSIEPGQTGRESFIFTFNPLISNQTNIIRHPTLDLEVDFTGTRFAEGNQSGSVVENVFSRKIKLSSDLQLTARTLYYVGPFKNTGPLPPTSDQETTYTVDWSIINSSNDLSGVIARATLPSYVRWIGAFSPNDEAVVYDPNSREIEWNIGDVLAGNGINSAARDMSFQVGFTPSVSQLKQYPVLISDVTVSGSDSYTGSENKSLTRAISIKLSTDPKISSDEDKPVK
ncbi:MAG: hypothetical protein HY226_02660 [Candidatus Vogelbacteria bacterium]|nr:hypothetical protein [Candidatus Vogelbacteria bacterium]